LLSGVQASASMRTSSARKSKVRRIEAKGSPSPVLPADGQGDCGAAVGLETAPAVLQAAE
jgi:hypothetical protein